MMTLRGVIVAGTVLVAPFAADAQAPLGYPVTGLYIGASGGFNIKANPSVKNLSGNLNPDSTGLSTPNLNLSTGIGAAAAGTIGYGLGNGLRVELEFRYASNPFTRVSGNNASGLGASKGTSGNEQIAGPMVNLDYDFVGVAPWVVPYLGVGVGYQRARLNDFATVPSGLTPALALLAPTITSNDTRGAFAAQGIVGAAFPIAAVPGLAITTEYRFMALTGTRTYNAGLTVNTPGGGTATRFGTFQLGHDYNNTFLFGIRYNFGVVPPPPPPAQVAIPAPAPTRSYLVFFDWDKATLTDRARQIIKEAADNSTRVQYTRIEVNGYTDTSGTPKYNQGLSVRRAEAVAAELVRNGVPKTAINIQGFGDTRLLVPTGPGVREPQNRRVEIVVR
jgi:outer membrane protein W